jgi:hypothetical protein
MATKFERVCPSCATDGANWHFHPADTEGCELEVRATEHSHLSCESCGHEWAEPAPHLRKRNYPSWALKPDQ